MSGESDVAQPLPALPPMRYPNAYGWLIFFSATDVILTWLILRVGGSEINPLAALLVHPHGDHMLAPTLFKFSLVLLAIIMCEAVGRLSDRKGRRLALTMVIIACFPVVWSISLLMLNRMTGA